MSGEHALSSWGSFYVIVGSAGGALIGLQFIMLTLIADMRIRTSSETLGAFGTPTVVHLTGALLVSAIMSAPWPSLFYASVVLTLCGLAGLAYSVVVIRRARRQTDYKPVWQDWWWYAVLPSGAYSILSLAPGFLRADTQVALFLIAMAAIGLLLIGIHNAWDSVTHLAVRAPNGRRRDQAPEPPHSDA